MKTKQIDVLVFTPLPLELAALRSELGKPAEDGVDTDFSYVVWRSVNLKDRISDGSLVAIMPVEKDQLPSMM
jgi:hypothetical protein